MRNNFRIILLITTPVIVLAFAFFISTTHSKMLSSHWATLECTNDKKSTTASKKITLGSRYLTQLRRDWIKNEMWRFMTALDNKGRFLSWKLNEEVDRYFSWEYTTNNSILYELNREDITFKITFFDKSETELFWVAGKCNKISPSKFKEKKEKIISELETKQKI